MGHSGAKMNERETVRKDHGQEGSFDHPISRRRARSRPRLELPDDQSPSTWILLAVSSGIAISWVITTELASAAQDSGFGGLTLLYGSTSLLGLLNLSPTVRRTRLEARRGGWVAQDYSVPGFLFLWLACNLCFMQALRLIQAATVTAVFSTNPIFVYFLSLFILDETADSLRLFSAALAVVGVALTALGAGGDHSSETEGVLTDAVLGAIYSLISAALAGLYKVTFFSLILCQSALGCDNILNAIVGAQLVTL